MPSYEQKFHQGMAPNVDFTLTFFDAYVIYSICKADSHRKMWS